MTSAERTAANPLVELLEPLARQEGRSPSLLEDVHFMRVSRSMPRTPIVYDPGIFIIGQGRKRIYLGDQLFTYDACNYLVLSVPLPLECETQASPQEPLLGIAIDVTAALLHELLMGMDDSLEVTGAVRGLYSSVLTEELTDATIRLLRCLKSPGDSRILGPQIVREITYRVLQGEQGGALRALAARHSRFSQIARTLRRLHQDYDEELDVETLAKEANMSVSTFHHNFKAVTSTSPLQYLKSIRLHKARMMMVHDGLNASTAAYRAGYVSASQFSREFKRMFGSSPAEDASQVRVAAD